jgi:hypothetical protein
VISFQFPWPTPLLLATDMDYPWFEDETKIGRAAGSTGAGWLVQCQRAPDDEIGATCKGNRACFGAPKFGRRLRHR